jgi:hypothetical protein
VLAHELDYGKGYAQSADKQRGNEEGARRAARRFILELLVVVFHVSHCHGTAHS